MAPRRHFQALVVGTGPAGLATGLALAHAGIGVAVVGPPANAHDGRTAALFQSSVQFLENIGAWAAITSLAEPITAIRIADATGSTLRAPEVTFHASEIGHNAFGYNVPTGALIAQLEKLAARQATRVVTAAVSYVDPDEQRIRLTTIEGAEFTANLVAAADGRNSICRKAAGIESKSWSYPQAALVCSFRHTRPHGGISTELHRRNGPLTMVPSPGNASSLVWVEAPAECERLAALDSTQFLAELKKHLGSLAGTINDVDERKVFPLSGQTAGVLAQNRVALIGEAGHVLPPIGAQGLNLSLRDAATLAELAADARALGSDIGSPELLAEFGRRRRVDVLSRIWTIDLMNRSLLSEFLPVHLARGLGLVALKTMAPLRRLVMREGVTPSFSTPRQMLAQSPSPALDGLASKLHHGANHKQSTS